MDLALRLRRAKTKLDWRRALHVIRTDAARGQAHAYKMSLKVLRGYVARKFLNCRKNVNQKSNADFLTRALATQVAPKSEAKPLVSPWGEIQVGKETLTEHVFMDIEQWADKPSVVRIFFLILIVLAYIANNVTTAFSIYLFFVLFFRQVRVYKIYFTKHPFCYNLYKLY